MITAISVSDDIDIPSAVAYVISDCAKQLHEKTPQAGILFTSCMDADLPEILARVNEAFPGIELVGCTTDGEITPAEGFSEDSVALLLIAAEKVQFSATVARDVNQDPTRAFLAAYDEGCQKLPHPPVCGVTFPDGLTTIGLSLDSAIRAAMGESFPIFGGTAGDHFQFKTTYQFCNDEVLTNSAPVLLMSGELDIAASVFTGPSPVGSSYRVDKSVGNVVHRINGQNVLDFYKSHLGEYHGDITQFPLAVYEDDGDDYYLRDPLFINEEMGVIEFVGTFPENARVRFAVVSREDIIDSANKANTLALKKLNGRTPQLVFTFPCTSRRHLLGSQTNKEFQVLREQGDIPFFGFYCYGEIGPFVVGRPVRFHNDTFVSFALVEKS